MKSENIIFNGYIPFYNNSNFNILEKEYSDRNKNNNNNNQSQSINLFKKNYRSKIPILNQRVKNKNYEYDLNIKKENSDENNILSCPNMKNKDHFANFAKISVKSKNLNYLYDKIHEFKKNNHILTPLKKINGDSFNTKIDIDNIDINKKEKEKEKQIEKLKIYMKQKENRLFNSSIPKKQNNTLNTDRFNNCFTVLSLKAQPIMNQKRINKTIDSKNKLFNKFLLKKKNIKISSLPKMNHSNHYNQKPNIGEINPTDSKTCFNIPKIKSKTHNEEIKDLLHHVNKKKNKLKNLVSFDAYSLPGTEKGKQKINQDSYLVLPNINSTKNCKIFGVFDGHGDNSDILSQEIRDYFIDYFSDNNIYKKDLLFNNNLNINKISNDEKLENVYNLFTKNNYTEINKLFENINNKLHDKYKDNNFCSKTGSTSHLLIVMNDKKLNSLNKIISIYLGDSKCLLITEDNQAIDLNIIHNPENLTEKERIEKNGGEISRVDWADYGPLRVFFKGKHYPGLAMTRAFGDFDAEILGINSTPDIREYDIFDKKPKIIILATDGIWQFLSNEKVKDIVLPYYEEDNIRGAVQKLVRAALTMWEMKNPNFIDDITVIIIFFR